MARVSTRIGWGRGSPRSLGLVAAFVVPAGALFVTGPRWLGWLLLSFALLPLFFAFVHAHRVLETDSDDDPSLRVGDLVDDD